MITCPICKNVVDILYRNKPKGEKARFACMGCLPKNMIPDDETVLEADQLNRAINPAKGRSDAM